MIILQPRKKCESCGRFLICFEKNHLHPSTPCAGIKDTIRIEAEVMDEALWKKWKELYGDPQMDDYERVAVLEELLSIEGGEKKALFDEAQRMQQKLSHPLAKFLQRFI